MKKALKVVSFAILGTVVAVCVLYTAFCTMLAIKEIKEEEQYMKMHN